MLECPACGKRGFIGEDWIDYDENKDVHYCKACDEDLDLIKDKSNPPLMIGVKK